MKLIKRNTVCKILDIPLGSLGGLEERCLIPNYIERVSCKGGYYYLWDVAEIMAVVDIVKAYRRGEQVTKAQRMYEKHRIRHIKVLDKYAVIFKQYHYSIGDDMKHTKIGRLKKHLEIIGHISKLEAAKYYHIYGCKEQINRLIAKGMKIKTVLTPNGKNSPFATYTLIK